MNFEGTMFQELGQNFRMADFFDITVIAIFLYLAITWFRHAASRSMIVGVSVVTVIYLLARTFSLTLTSLLFQGAFAVLVVALVVVFQEDIRRGFERIALLGTFRDRRRPISSSVSLDSLIEVMTTLAEKKTGALVVFKGQEPLERHIQGGIVLHGKISKPLLYSIFDPHSAGHDGAVLIEEDRMARFGCQLPLSKNLREVGTRGTRHTAALGLSECSDALILAVSEERGDISIAKGGRLTTVGSAAELKDQLNRFWQAQSVSSRAGFWRNLFRQDARIKVLSVALACLAWFFFAYQLGTIHRTFVVPVEYRNLPADWILEGPKQAEAKITLSGSERAFYLLNPTNLILSMDLSGIQEGAQQLAVTAKSLKNPSNLSLYRVEPDVIGLKAHQVVTRELPVEVQTTGRLRRGLELTALVPHPPQVKAKVWKSLGEKTQKLPTEPLSLKAIEETQTLQATLLVPAHVRLVETGSAVVEVKVVVTDTTEPVATPEKK